jgi:hypothetical protein
MLYVLFYLVALPLLAIGLISAVVFIWNVFRDLGDEKVLDPAVLESFHLPSKPSLKLKSRNNTGSNGDEPCKTEEQTGPDWSKLLDRISAIRVEDSAEVERYALTYFSQFGGSKINFPKECTVCGNKTAPQVLKWKTIHKIPALRGTKTSAKVDTNSLWTIVGRCHACDRRFILAAQQPDKIMGDLEWAYLQPDNFDRLIAFEGKKVSREKLGFVFRTLPDRSLIASGATGEWIWLKSEYRNYV